jgi:hypothetical protein
MMQILYVGLIAGCMLFFSKLGITFFFPRWLKGAINLNNFTLLLFDFALGAMAATVIKGVDGTIAMITSITFGTLSLSYIFLKKGAQKVKKLGGEFLCTSARY